jgi:signal transduction histidine kinase/ligand-binding sensor domain-containing protein
MLVAMAVLAADPSETWRVRPWQSDEGLPDNSVYGLAQTKDGYIWVGTPSGLARFDGVHFESFSLTNVVALPNRGIITMLTGRDGALWLAMDRGAVVCLRGAASRSYAKSLPNDIPNGMAEAADGTVLVTYRTGDVYEIHNGRVTQLTSGDGLPAGPDICAVTSDQRGRLWFAKSGQVGIFEGGKLRTLCRVNPAPLRLAAANDGRVWVCAGFHLFKCDDAGRLDAFGKFQPENSGTIATVMMEDHEGAVWIGTSFSGLFRYDQSGFALIPTTHQGIMSLMEDQEGDIWAGTFGGGLNRIRRRTIVLEGAGAGLPFSSVQSVCEDTNGTIWAVTQNGVLVSKEKDSDEWTAAPLNQDWPGQATCVTVDGQGTLWIGTRAHVIGLPTRGLYCRRNGQIKAWEGTARHEIGTLHTLLAARDGDLWMGQESPAAVLRLHHGRIQTYPAPPDSRIIRAMVQDAAGNIWAGTSKGVLLRVAGDHLVNATPRTDAELASIRCLYATPDGALWIGYAGWGLGCLWQGHYTEINAADGLYDDYISHIVDDGHGWLWFGANRGLFKVRIQDLQEFRAKRISQVRSVHYGRDEGLPSLQGTFGDSPDVLRDHQGRLWIPMQTALVVADPGKQNSHPAPPPVRLTRVLMDDRVIGKYWGILPAPAGYRGKIADLASPGVKLHLPPDHRRVQFDFAALSFRAPENIQFQYRLKDVDGAWVEGGTHHSASYPRLAGGKYTFQVTACGNDGTWNPDLARVNFVVSPFFWQTWWFRLLSLALFTGMVIAIVRYVSFRRLQQQLRALAQLAALQKERARIAKDIHDDLGADLTQIAFMGELAQQDRGEPEQVAGRIAKISATARQAIKSLDEIVWAVNPHNDTLAHLIDYAGQFALDFLRLAGIRCRADFPDQIPERELSTDLRHNLFLVIKESLHNIVKHAGATEVWLRVKNAETFLEITIEDNGYGFDHADKTPDDALADGLRNMRQRMTDIGGECCFESQPGRGTKVILRLPWPKEDSNVHSIA